MSSPHGTKKKADLKVVILGAASVGKTTLIHRYIEGKYQDTISTIGASFSLKQWGPHNVAIWDTAGEERFAGLSSFYCRGAGAAILAFDITCEDSFHSLRARFIPLLQSADESCLSVVVGTKTDLVTPGSQRVAMEEGLRLAREVNKNCARLKEVPYFETSSISGQNVNRVFEFIFEYCLKTKGPIITKSPSVVDLEKKPDNKKEKGGCCG